MRVEFHRTGKRRYAVRIIREDLPDLEMNPAPGFDALMPHDLLHFLVESELNLKHAIFGQVATGENTGNFLTKPSEDSNTRADSRFRRKESKQRKKIIKNNIDEYLQSERATIICMYDWLAHSADENLLKRAAEMEDTAQSVQGQMTEIEKQKLDKQKLARIRKRMDELSARWSALKVNESMIVEW
ncbi:MAG: hypothetical protein ABIP06_08375 [Pyrinomonadaceae bacterium]